MDKLALYFVIISATYSIICLFLSFILLLNNKKCKNNILEKYGWAFWMILCCIGAFWASEVYVIYN